MAKKLSAEQQAAVEEVTAKLHDICDANGISGTVIIAILEALRTAADSLAPQYAVIIDMIAKELEKLLGGGTTSAPTA
jgi:hypothetical protein